jgi:hypothetical protein
MNLTLLCMKKLERCQAEVDKKVIRKTSFSGSQVFAGRSPTTAET